MIIKWYWLLDNIIVKLIIKVNTKIKFQTIMKDRFLGYIYNYVQDYMTTLIYFAYYIKFLLMRLIFFCNSANFAIVYKKSWLQKSFTLLIVYNWDY